MNPLPPDNENFIFELPEELKTPEWERVKQLLPAEYFIQGVFIWVFQNAQEPLNDMLEILITEAEEPFDYQQVEDLIVGVANKFKEYFDILLKTLVPKDYSNDLFIAELRYNEKLDAIYLIFEENTETISATDIISSENDDEEDDDDDTDDTDDENVTDDDGDDES